MPWNVALWWQLSRLRLAIELDCDARVIARRNHDALVYTRLLLSVGERVRSARHPVLAMSRSRSALAKRFDALLRRDVIEPRRAVGLVVLAMGMLASVAFVPSPSVSGIVNLIRPVPRAEPVVVAPLRAEPANIASASPAVPSPSTIVQRTPRATSPRRRTLTPNVDVNTLPPVSVVPPAMSRNSLDGVVAPHAAVRPTMRSFGGAGGVIMAAPGGGVGGGGARGRGGFAATRPVSPGDSNTVVARGGGRGVLVARPDTIRPPR
jgi:hypothetical protein